MDVVPDLKKNVWHFGHDSEIEVCGIVEESKLFENQLSRLNEMLDEKFTKVGTGLGYTNVANHEIILEENTRTIKQRYYPVSPYKQKILDEEIKKMLEMDVIEASKSSWSSPVLLVPKGDNTYRFCVDYRALNRVTKKDAYPLPYVSAILDRLRGARYLSSMDIKSAYWQVSVKEECRELTAFTVPSRGLYQFKRMPFGLANAPAT
uniref:Transposon Ty3-I Gag-Pol polyprotein n=1 Tax=Anoplophora glabripennis TaxID=217634 RepID=V5GMA9_ANOGL